MLKSSLTFAPAVPDQFDLEMCLQRAAVDRSGPCEVAMLTTEPPPAVKESNSV